MDINYKQAAVQLFRNNRGWIEKESFFNYYTTCEGELQKTSSSRNKDASSSGGGGEGAGGVGGSGCEIGCESGGIDGPWMALEKVMIFNEIHW